MFRVRLGNTKMNAKVSVFVILVGVSALAVLLVLITKDYPFGTWRYRVTVNIVTPEGTKSGSAVRELRVHTEPGFLGVRKQGVARLVGEAVVIDLGKRGVLFALLSEDDLFHAFPYNNGAGVLAPDGIRFYNGLKAGMKASLPADHYPRFVMFKDLSEPKSVQLAYGARLDVATQKILPVDEVEGLFGVGVRIRDINIEITSDPVTWNVVDWLPWLPMFRSQMFDGNRNQALGVQNPTANSMSMGSFTTRR